MVRNLDDMAKRFDAIPALNGWRRTEIRYQYRASGCMYGPFFQQITYLNSSMLPYTDLVQFGKKKTTNYTGV